MDRLRPVGFYNIDGQSLTGSAPLKDSISARAHPEEPHILSYLAQGVNVMGCGGVVPDCLDRSLPIRLGLDILSDGVWQWPQFLEYYIMKYHLQIPEDFVEHMRKNDWIVPEVSAQQLEEKVVLFGYGPIRQTPGTTRAD